LIVRISSRLHVILRLIPVLIDPVVSAALAVDQVADRAVVLAVADLVAAAQVALQDSRSLLQLHQN
jgi:hypothetical protein